MAGTFWTDFVAATKVKFSEMNENFDWREGSIVPNNSATTANVTYDLGTSTSYWRTLFLGTSIVINGTTITNVDNSTIANTGASLSVTTLRIKTNGIRGSTANIGGSQQEIFQGTVSTPDIRNNSCTSPTTSAGEATNGASTITSVSITTQGGPVLLIAHASIIIQAGATARVTSSIDRAGTAITGGFTDYNTATGSPPTQTAALCMETIDPVAAGTYTYNLKYNLIVGTVLSVPYYNLTAIELKK